MAATAALIGRRDKLATSVSINTKIAFLLNTENYFNVNSNTMALVTEINMCGAIKFIKDAGVEISFH